MKMMMMKKEAAIQLLRLLGREQETRERERECVSERDR